jgi:alpha-glucosidase
MDGYRVFTTNTRNFPDLSKLANDLQSQGINLVTILDPGVKEDSHYWLYREGKKEKHFCTTPDGKSLVGLVWPGRALFPDFTQPDTRRWWGEKYAILAQLGIAGYWHDMNEPTSFTAWGDMRLPMCTWHHIEGQGGNHQQAHNLYGLLMAQAGYEGLRKHKPAKRPWILTRSGWIGVQRYAWHWTGDTETSWQILHQTIATVLNLGLSGIPYTGSDIGGFSGNPDPELYLRWFQLSTFLPFFRTHSAKGTNHREPWCFGEPTTSIIRKFLNLRYKLIPYLYSLAWETNQRGIPPIRPLFWKDLQCQELWDTDAAFMLGDSLLIAPILKEGATSKTI